MSESKICRYCAGYVQEHFTVSFNGFALCSVTCHSETVRRVNEAKALVLGLHEVQQPNPMMQRGYDKACELLEQFGEPLPTSEEDLNPVVIRSQVREYERAKWRGYVFPWH